VTFPSSRPPVPTVVRRFADGRPVRAVWVNDEGGVTFRLGADGSGRDFVKVANARGTDFAAEARRLRWAARYLTVPQVLGFGVDADGGPGRGGVRDRCGAARTARPIAGAHMSFRVVGGRPRALGRAAAGRSAGGLSRRRVCTQHADRRRGPLLRARRLRRTRCGRPMGRSRGGDAVVGLELSRPGMGAEFFAAYGVEPDPARIDYYRRLWQASDGTSR
jgi:kanamycin kinase